MTQLGSIVSYRNFVDAAPTTIAAKSYDPGTGIWTNLSVVANSPLSNLKVRQLSKTAVIGDYDPATNTPLDNIVLEVNFGTVKLIDVIGVLNCNTTDSVGDGNGGSLPMGDYSIQISSSTDGVAWSQFYTVNGSDNIAYRIAGNLIVVLDPAIVAATTGMTVGAPNHALFAQFVRVRIIYDRSDNFWSFGRLWIGDSIVALVGADAGWNMDFNDTGTVTETKGSQNYENAGMRNRILTCTFSDLPCLCVYGRAEDAAVGDRTDEPSFQGMQKTTGITGDLIVIPRTDSQYWIADTAVYGHAAHSYAIQRQAGPNYSVSLVINEEH